MTTDKHWESRLPKGWEISILEDSKKLDEARSNPCSWPSFEWRAGLGDS